MDPSIGRYRNMVQTAFIPTTKRPCIENIQDSCPFDSFANIKPSVSNVPLSNPKCFGAENTNRLITNMTFSSAPVVNNPEKSVKSNEKATSLLETLTNRVFHDTIVDLQPTSFPKKIYAKEIWPGKKNTSERSTNFLF